jgi:selenocysteine-specific elongation factor
LVAGRGDRLVLRSYSPASTIAGAQVLDPLPPRRKRADAPVLAALRGADARAAAVAFAGEAGALGLPLPELAARLTLPLEAAAAAANTPALVSLGELPAYVLGREAIERLRKETLAAVKAYHRTQPLKPGMPREELRERVFAGAAPPVFGHVLAALAASGDLKQLPDAVALASHEVRLSAGEAEARQRLVQAAEAAGLAGIEAAALAEAERGDAALFDRVARVLVTEKVLGRVGETMLVARGQLEQLKQAVRERWAAGSKIEVSAFKEMTGLSRKYVIPLLEFLDRERVTRRVGNDRVVL